MKRIARVPDIFFSATSFSSNGLMAGPGDLLQQNKVRKDFFNFKVDIRVVGIDKVTFCHLDRKVAGKQDLDGKRVT